MSTQPTTTPTAPVPAPKKKKTGRKILGGAALVAIAIAFAVGASHAKSPAEAALDNAIAAAPVATSSQAPSTITQAPSTVTQAPAPSTVTEVPMTHPGAISAVNVMHDDMRDVKNAYIAARADTTASTIAAVTATLDPIQNSVGKVTGYIKSGDYSAGQLAALQAMNTAASSIIDDITSWANSGGTTGTTVQSDWADFHAAYLDFQAAAS